MVGIKEIAAMVGLSRHTVSDILNGDDPRYSEKTRAKVRKVAQSVGYRPNRVAQSLRLKRTRSIGIISFQSIHELSEMRLQNVLKEVNATGYHPVISNGNWHVDGIREAFGQMQESRIAGLLIVNPSFPYSEQKKLLGPFLQQKVPIVCLGGHSQKGIPRFMSDKRYAFHQITRHLIDSGCRRIALLLERDAYLSDNSYDWHARMAIEGYRNCLGEAGLEAFEDINILSKQKNRLHLPRRYDGDPYIEGYEGMWHVLNRRGELPDAVMCGNDSRAYGALRACRERGLNIPEDMALCGLEDELSSRYGILSLTTFRQPLAELAKRAVAHLLELIESDKMGEDRIETVPGELVVRESSVPGMRVPPLHEHLTNSAPRPASVTN